MKPLSICIGNKEIAKAHLNITDFEVTSKEVIKPIKREFTIKGEGKLGMLDNKYIDIVGLNVKANGFPIGFVESLTHDVLNDDSIDININVTEEGGEFLKANPEVSIEISK